MAIFNKTERQALNMRVAAEAVSSLATFLGERLQEEPEATADQVIEWTQKQARLLKEVADSAWAACEEEYEERLAAKGRR